MQYPYLLTPEQRQAIIEFQRWRNGQFAELAEERRRVAGNRRHDAARSTANPIYMEECASKSDHEADGLAVLESRYATVCVLDAHIKAKYQDVKFFQGGVWHTPSELPPLETLLDQAAVLMASPG